MKAPKPFGLIQVAGAEAGWSPRSGARHSCRFTAKVYRQMSKNFCAPSWRTSKTQQRLCSSTARPSASPPRQTAALRYEWRAVVHRPAGGLLRFVDSLPWLEILDVRHAGTRL